MAPVTGGKERRSMKKRISYTDEPMGNVQMVKDFLPAPDKLVLKEENVKVTIALSKSSVSFFKKIAKKHRTPYQAMIRRILSLYAEKYSQ
jgi:predicted DNA binding CopG/RHH family protein